MACHIGHDVEQSVAYQKWRAHPDRKREDAAQKRAQEKADSAVAAEYQKRFAGCKKGEDDLLVLLRDTAIARKAEREAMGVELARIAREQAEQYAAKLARLAKGLP